ncbi:MAG: 50S ribosomal protein L11 [bacterium]|nr:50S ribosomal protein L11 [bacterium]
MAKKIKTYIKLNLPAGEATPAPPVGTALGPHGLPLMDFVKAFNEKTAEHRGDIVPVVISVYEDRTFSFITKKSPVAASIKKTLGLEKGSGVPQRDKVGKLTQAQVREIAENKMEDMNANTVEAAMNIVAGTARSMGVDVEK